jgi:undecaprenyl-diphosphatase
MFAQAALLALLYRRRRVTVIAFTFASLIALSRVYVGVHYPADVTAGAIFGMLTGAFVYFSVSAIAHKYFRQKWRSMFTKKRDVQTESKQTST